MPVLGLTGGVATGKSVFLENLLPLLPSAEVYDADAAVHRLLNTSCKGPVIAAFGKEIINDTGGISRPKLRQRVLADESARRLLESILHPAVEREWRSLVAQLRQAEAAPHPPREVAPCKWLILAIPLLYEVGADQEMDVTAVVACQPETQISRMISNRGLDERTARAFLKAQWPVAKKIERCDFLVWNDGPLPLLTAQAKLLACRLLKCQQAYARR